MTTLLITLKGPLQSWSTTEGYAWRTTDPVPSKSGVLGLAASALGMPRDAPMDALASLRFGVRTVRPGRRLRDLQTMGWTRTGRRRPKPNPLQTKEYVQDAEFLAGLEGPDATLGRIRDALAHPVHAPYLGRRGCPPAGPIPTAMSSLALEDALEGEGPILVEDPQGGTIRWDRPLGDHRYQSTAYRETDPYLDAILAAQTERKPAHDNP